MPAAADAAVLGSLVDELVIGVHRTVAARHGQEFRERFDALDLTQPGVVIDLAEFLVAEACTEDVVRLRFRYETNDPMGPIDDLVHRQLLSPDLRPGTAIRELCEIALARRSDVAAMLWPGELEPERAGAIRSIDGVSGPLARAFAGLLVPDEPGASLHHLLTTLRYERMDAHAAAWAGHDLSATEIVELTVASSPDASVGATPSRGPLRRGLIGSDGSPTPAGRAVRRAIEDQTNRRCVPLLDAVDHWADWTLSLRALADNSSLH